MKKPKLAYGMLFVVVWIYGYAFYWAGYQIGKKNEKEPEIREIELQRPTPYGVTAMDTITVVDPKEMPEDKPLWKIKLHTKTRDTEIYGVTKFVSR